MESISKWSISIEESPEAEIPKLIWPTTPFSKKLLNTPLEIYFLSPFNLKKKIASFQTITTPLNHSAPPGVGGVLPTLGTYDWGKL